MKKVKLTLLSLFALSAMSLASCAAQGPQGEKGDKGDQGEQGPQGEPGENGEDGEDGSLWHTGSGVPSSELGKVGDMYLDTSTNNVYQKESTGWVLKTNIQGDPGEDGEDGENGRPGSNGSNGQTAWSNTILPVEGGYGYVLPSVGSQISGLPISFSVVDANPSDSYVPYTLNLISSKGEEVISLDETTTYETTMVDGGYVVSATFVEAADSSSDLSTKLSNLPEGETTIVLDGDLSFSNELAITSEVGHDVIIDGRNEATLSTGNTTLFNLTNAKGNVTLKNFVIDRDSGTKSAFNIQIGSETGDVHIDGVTFDNLDNNVISSNVWVNIRGKSRTNKIVIENCVFNNYGAINLNGSDSYDDVLSNVEIINNDFSNIYDWANAITIQANLENVTISGNKYISSGADTGSLVLFHRNISKENLDFSAKNVVINNNEGDSTREYWIDNTKTGTVFDSLFDLLEPLLGKEGYIDVTLNGQTDPDTTTSLTKTVEAGTESSAIDTLLGNGSVTSSTILKFGAGETEYTSSIYNGGINLSQGKTVVFEGTLDEEGNIASYLNLKEDLTFNGEGKVIFRNLNLSADSDINGERLLGFNDTMVDIEFENVDIELNGKITSGNNAPIFIYSPNADVNISNVTIKDNTETKDAYSAGIQLFRFKNVNIDNVTMSDAGNPITIHELTPGAKVVIKDSNFDSRSTIFIADNSSAYTTEGLEGLKADKPSITFENVTLNNERDRFGYYGIYAGDNNDVDASYLDINFINCYFNGSRISTDIYEKEIFNISFSGEQGDRKILGYPNITVDGNIVSSPKID